MASDTQRRLDSGNFLKSKQFSLLSPKRKLNPRMEALEHFCQERRIKTVLEFGTFFGSSTYFFLRAGCDVTTVDLTRYEYIFDHQAANIIIADDTHLPLRDSAKFDLVLIDSSHEYRHTMEEIDVALRHALTWLAFDDISWFGVNRAIRSRGLRIELIGPDLGVCKIRS